MKNFLVPSLRHLVGRVKSEAPRHLEALRTNPHLLNLNNWYTKVLGLDEVKLYQDRVVALQERLLGAQEKRREISRALAEVRLKSNQLQDELHKVKRQDDLDKFLSLMKAETEVLRHENEIGREFQECDRYERELFSAFTNAVRDSHEKQRAQLEYTKYFGIILSITGSFLAFCYSNLRKNDLKRFIESSLVNNTSRAEDGNLVKVLVENETERMFQLRQSQIVKETVRLLQASEDERNVDEGPVVVLQTANLWFYVAVGALVLLLLKSS